MKRFIERWQRFDVGGWLNRPILWAFYGAAMVVLLWVCLWPAQAQAAPHSNTLTWAASPTSNVTGYNVWRAPGSCTGTFTKLTATPITALTFTDSGMADGAVNCYLVTAVSPTGESPQSMSQTILLTTPTTTASVVPAPPGPATATSQ